MPFFDSRQNFNPRHFLTNNNFLTHNLGQNISRLSRNSRPEVFWVFSCKFAAYFQNTSGWLLLTFIHCFVQYLFIPSETELDYYHQKVNVRVTSRVHEQLKMDLRKLGNFKRITGMLGYHG